MVLIFCKKKQVESHVFLDDYVCGKTYKIHANRTDIALCICVIGESKQQTGLSNAGIADQQQFEKIIAVEVKKKMCALVKVYISTSYRLAQQLYYNWLSYRVHTVETTC